jgi:hypothetical protein
MSIPPVIPPAPAPRPVCGRYICESCGLLDTQEWRSSGSGWVLVALFFFFCVPGIIYGIWMACNQRCVCSQCGGKPIHLGSPRGQALCRQFHQ